MNIEDEIDILISKYMPNEIPNEKLQNMRRNVIEQITNTEERLQDNLLYSFGDNYLIILKTYNVVTNIYLRITILILCIVDIAILCVLEKYRALKSIKDIKIIYAQAAEKVGKETDRVKFMKSNPVGAICIYHKGSYENLRDSYNTILKYIESNKYEIILLNTY